MSAGIAEKPKGIPFGNYFLLERLAIGGMAEVYLAKSFGVSDYERLVAVKRILPTIAEDEEFIAMFIDEAKIAGQLSHPNIASILDLGKIGSSYFIAMEYISGHDLRAIWERARESEAGMDIAMACHAIRRVCAGLDYAHRRRDNRGRPLGIIHRDVSPQNVLVGYDGRVKIIDFGIAKAANRTVRTQTGILKGKFAYMAPEQARGELIDNRSDIFAIGVMFYEMLTGERAFKAETDFALLEKVRKVDVIPPRKLNPKVSRDLERIVFRALAREPQDRYRYASEMATDIERAMNQHGLRYNREEMAAYVKMVFRDDHAEELRRIEQYAQIQVGDAGGGKSKKQRRGGRSLGASQKAPSAAPPPPGSDEIFEAGTVVSPVEGISALRDDAPAPPMGETQLSGEHPGFASSDVEDATVTSRPNPAALSRRVTEAEPSGGLFSSVVPPTAGSEMTVVDTNPVSSEVLPSLHETVARSQTTPPRSAPRPRLPAATAQRMPPEASRPVPESFAPKPPPPRGNGIWFGLIAAAAGVALLTGAAMGAFVFAPTDDVYIATSPASTEVRANEQLVCSETPCAARLGVGEHELLFQAKGFASLSKTVVVDGEEPVRLVVALSGAQAAIALQTDPKGAKVTLNGKKLSKTTPLELPGLVVGDAVTLKIERDGYVPVDQKIAVPDLEGKPWVFVLPAAETQWALKPVPSDAVIDAGGKRNEGDSRIAVPFESQVPVRVERPGCETKMLVLGGTGQPSDKIDVKLECKKLNATLTVLSKSRIMVDIDGVSYPAKRWVAKYKLPAGELPLKLRGRRSGEQILVTLEAGKETQVPTTVR